MKTPSNFTGRLALNAHVSFCAFAIWRDTRSLFLSLRQKPSASEPPSPADPNCQLLEKLLGFLGEFFVFFKLGGKRGMERSSLHSQTSWEHQQHLLLRRNSSPFGNTLPRLEASTGGRGLFWALSWAQGKEKT